VKPLTLLDETEARACCAVTDEPGLGALSTPRGNLPLKLLAVDARVVGLFAETTLRQTFVNTLGVPLEATYIFPLPDRAAATRFRLEVGERVVEGLLQERGQARATYDAALRAGHRAAITEEERPGVFTMRVGNLMPGDEATVWLTLVGPVPFADGEATFQLPLVVAPRYMPGSALPGGQVGDGVARDTDATPDASRISPPVLLPGFPNPVRLSIDVTIDPAGLPLGKLRSSLPATCDDCGEGTHVRVTPGARLDRDFILRWNLAGASLRTSLALSPDEKEPGTSTFCLTLVPPTDAGARRPKDVVLVLDRSGSMQGWKMVAARRATARMIDTLTPLDRFAVLAFDNAVETPPQLGADLSWATDRNRFKAVEFLAKLESRGGTEMAQPLSSAARTLLAPSVGEVRDKVLVLITDGQVGNEDQLLRTLGADLARLRVFTLGVDQAVNAAFLRRLAAMGGGSCELVESEDRLDEVMDKVHRRIDTPVLTDVTIEGEGLDLIEATIVPGRLPDLFPGAPLVVLGRCAGGAGTIKLRAVDASGMRYDEALAPSTRAATRAVTAAWARGLVRQLEDRYLVASSHEQAQLERRIIDTSLRFSVLCRFTSFVAVDKAEVVNQGGVVHKVVQAVEQPAGWSQQQSQKPGLQAMPARCAPAAGGMVMPAVRMSAPPSPPAPSAVPDALDWLRDGSAASAPGAAAASVFSGPSSAFDDAFSLEAPGGDPFAAPPGRAAKADASFDAGKGKLRRETSKKKCAPPPIAGARKPAPEPTPVGADAAYDGYRRRAEELVTLLAAQVSTSIERQRELGRLIVLLERLLDDLRSVGAPAHLVRPLEELVRERAVVRKYAAGQLADQDVERLWRRAADALRDYVRGAGGAPSTPPPASGGRREFWK
jgi:Ca-activated chloride channel homolog